MKKTTILLTVLVIGLVGCSRSPGIQLDPDSQDFLEYARLIMTKTGTDHLRPSARHRVEKGIYR